MLTRLAALSAEERAVVVDAVADRRGAPLVEEPASDEEAVAYAAMTGSETTDADVDTGDDVAERDVLESGNPGLKSYPFLHEVTELSEAPVLGEHDNAGQRAAQACPDISQQVVTSADVRIYPAIDPYGERDPQWVRGMLQAIGPIADAVSTLPSLPGRNRIVGLLLQVVDALAPVLLEIPIPKEKRGKIVSLLRTYCGYEEFVDQLVRWWEEADEAQARRNGTQLDIEQPDEPEADAGTATTGKQALAMLDRNRLVTRSG